VAEEWRPEQLGSREPRVLVRLHGRFADAYNRDPEPVKGMYWRVKRSHIRSMGAQQPAAELSLLVVRWWDYWNPRNRRSRSHNVANEEMLLDVLEGPGSPHALFGERGSYEVHSAFVRNSADLESMGQALAAAMRGKCQAGLYFLWPTQHASDARRLPGAVAEPALLGLMERMEAAGVPTRWPHPLNLYRQMAGKLWVPRVSCERPDLCVPLTVRLDMAKWDADQRAAAEDAIAELQRLRAASPGGRAPAEGTFRGVAKLGFSWMGADVRPFTGAAELVSALRHLLEGAQRDTVCLVQERIEDVACELRFLCCQDLAQGPEAVKKEILWMKLHAPQHNSDETFHLTSHQTMGAQEAADYAFCGSMEALRDAEKKAAGLADLWLQWFRQEGYGTPATCRLDFLVSVPARRRGRPEASVWTVELCECGGSLCGLLPHGRTTACLNACLAGSASLPPQPLPPLRSPPTSSPQGRSAEAGGPGSQSPAASGGVVQALRAAAGDGRGRRLFAALLAVLLLLFARMRRGR